MTNKYALINLFGGETSRELPQTYRCLRGVKQPFLDQHNKNKENQIKTPTGVTTTTTTKRKYISIIKKQTSRLYYTICLNFYRGGISYSK